MFMQDTYWRNEQRRAMTSLQKYVPLTLLQGFEKGYSGFYCERELETEQKLQYFDPTLMALSGVSFSFSWCSTRGPGAHSAGFLYYFLSATSLDADSSGAPRAPDAWCGFPYYISSNFVRSVTVWLPVLTELYNSSTSTQSPTQSLEWHVWSSSSGNNCHAVYRSLSSGASVYECTMGFFYLVPFSQPSPPTWSLAITGHWNV